MPFAQGHQGFGGRPHGALQLRTQKAIKLFEQFEFDPLAKKIILAKTIENQLPRVDPAESLEYHKLYALMLTTLLKYCYPQLKHSEHTGQITHVHTTEQLATMSDIELQAYVISYRTQEALPPGEGS